MSRSPSSQPDEKAADRTLDEPVPHIHGKTIILLIVRKNLPSSYRHSLTELQAVVGGYFVQVIHVTGLGVMAQTITAEIGGGSRATWLTETIAITAGTLSPPISQAADFWGRKWLVVGFTACGAVGCLIVSRADNFGTLIGGQCMSTAPLVQL